MKYKCRRRSSAFVIAACSAFAGLAATAADTLAQECESCQTSVGMHCATIYMPGTHDSFGASCGASASVSFATSVSLGFEVTCQELTFTFALQKEMSIECGCTSSPCTSCSLLLCFPNSTVTRRVCTVKRRVFIPDGDFVCGHPQGYWEDRETKVVSHSFVSGGRAVCSSCVSDASCVCQALGQPCECSTQPEPSPCAHNEAPQRVIQGFSALSLDVSQFDDETPVFGPMERIDAATVGQLRRIHEALDSSLATCAELPTHLTLYLPGGDALAGDTFRVLKHLDQLLLAAASSPRRFDLNGDSTLDAADLAAFDSFRLMLRMSQLELSRLDFDGDGLANAQDRCLLVAAIAQHWTKVTEGTR